MMHWLVGHFRVLGIEIQNWMLLIGFIVALWLFYIIAMGLFEGSNFEKRK
jgi:hypothetical protein